MEQMIIGFDQDELGDWRAILACGHRQHVRHNPPLVNRPWVQTAEGRDRFLGATLDCVACDDGEPVGDGIVSAETLEAIYARFAADLGRFVRRRAADPDTAETILRAAIPRIRDAGDEPGDEWPRRLAAILRGAIAAHDRPAPAGDAAGDDAHPEDTAELAAAVRALLDCLPGRLRQALILTDTRGLDPAQIAGRLDIPLADAEARVRAGRATLREALLDWCRYAADRAEG
jgi:DNA-directed RNA polymerase specialized sigma24 family protein